MIYIPTHPVATVASLEKGSLFLGMPRDFYHPKKGGLRNRGLFTPYAEKINSFTCEGIVICGIRRGGNVMNDCSFF